MLVKNVEFVKNVDNTSLPSLVRLYVGNDLFKETGAGGVEFLAPSRASLSAFLVWRTGNLVNFELVVWACLSIVLTHAKSRAVWRL